MYSKTFFDINCAKNIFCSSYDFYSHMVQISKSLYFNVDGPEKVFDKLTFIKWFISNKYELESIWSLEYTCITRYREVLSPICIVKLLFKKRGQRRKNCKCKHHCHSLQCQSQNFRDRRNVIDYLIRAPFLRVR